MDLNSDLTKRVIMQQATQPWLDAPTFGVRQRILERASGEAARTTSVVRYQPGLQLVAHAHELGEELVVLDGALADELGSYGAGTYIKNPPGSSYASASGCTLFLKQHHLNASDDDHLVVNTAHSTWHPGLVVGLSVMPLSEFGTEHTALVRWAPGTRFNPHRHYGGEEIFVLDGVFEDEYGRYPAGTWMRNPHLSTHTPFSTEGCIILVKTGHLLSTAQMGSDA